MNEKIELKELNLNFFINNNNDLILFLYGLISGIFIMVIYLIINWIIVVL